MAKATVLYTKLYPIIASSMKQPKNLTALKQFYGEIISKNAEALSSAVPDKAIFMDARTETKYYNAIGISAKEILSILAESPDVSRDWQTVKNPMYISLTMLLLYFNNIKNNDMVQQTMFMCSLYMYRNVRSKYFKRTTETTVNIMNYTISRLSYKNDLKKEGSIMKMISKKSEMFINNWFIERKAEVTGAVTDETIVKMINDNHRRYSTAMNNFYAEFKVDHTNGNYLNVDTDVNDGENYIETDNVSFMVEKTSQKVMNKFNLTTFPDNRILQHTCSIETGCTINNLRNMVNYIYNGHDDILDKIVRLIIQIYLFDYKKQIDDIKTADFLITMKGHYKKQTATDENLNQLKAEIDKVIVGSGIAKKINRAATLNDCKKGFLLYVLFMIQRYLL